MSVDPKRTSSSDIDSAWRQPAIQTVLKSMSAQTTKSAKLGDAVVQHLAQEPGKVHHPMGLGQQAQVAGLVTSVNSRSTFSSASSLSAAAASSASSAR
jgi:hypothetical protein